MQSTQCETWCMCMCKRAASTFIIFVCTVNQNKMCMFFSRVDNARMCMSKFECIETFINSSTCSVIDLCASSMFPMFPSFFGIIYTGIMLSVESKKNYLPKAIFPEKEIRTNQKLMFENFDWIIKRTLLYGRDFSVEIKISRKYKAISLKPIWIYSCMVYVCNLIIEFF